MGIGNYMSYIIKKIQQHAQQQPHAIAISASAESITYADLLKQIVKLAEHLKSSEYQCIGLLADNSINWAIIDLACLQADVCCIPVPAFFTQQQMQHLCQSAGVQALMGDADLVTNSVIDTHANSYSGNLNIVVCDLVKPTSYALNQIAKITFTSGSTGTPKGVCLSPEQIENTVKALNQVVIAGTSMRHLSVLPLITLLENIAGLYLSLVQGAEIMLYPMAQIE